MFPQLVCKWHALKSSTTVGNKCRKLKTSQRVFFVGLAINTFHDIDPNLPSSIGLRYSYRVEPLAQLSPQDESSVT